MSFIKSMQNRYTTKEYDAAKKIDPLQLEELKEILRLCPSSINSQPWFFTFISSPEKRNEIALASRYNNEKIKSCDTVIVFSRIDNIQLFENQLKQSHPQRAVDYYNQFIKPLSDEQIKAWFSRQVYLALGVFLGACANMNIDSTPMEGIDTQQYDEILGLKDYSTLAAVAIGFRDKNDFNQLDKKPKSRKDLSQIIKSI